MAFLRSLLSSSNRHLHRSFSPKPPSRLYPLSNQSRSFLSLSSANVQEIPPNETIQAIQDTETSPNATTAKKKKKPLDLFFQEAVGLIKKIEESDFSDGDDDSMSTEIKETEKKLRALERKLKIPLPNSANANSKEKKVSEMQVKDGTGEAKRHSLHALFAGPPHANAKSEDSISGVEGLSEEMVSFVTRLYENGYLIDANLAKDGRLDLNCLTSSYSYDYVKYAAERFGQDQQEMARRLSGNDLKKVAVFGCPSIERRTVFAAKSLRSFFGIREDIVCQPCRLKGMCKYANQRVAKRWKLDLKDALRVLSIYGLGSLPQQLKIPDEIKVSIGKLLEKAVALGK